MNQMNLKSNPLNLAIIKGVYEEQALGKWCYKFQPDGQQIIIVTHEDRDIAAKLMIERLKLAGIVFKKCGSAKKIKHEALGCRVGKKSVFKFVCRPDVSIIFCQFNGCCVGLYACL